MLDLDLDMEADLGIDTVKQAETFAAIREAFDIPRRDDVSYAITTRWKSDRLCQRNAARPGGQRTVISDSEPEAVSPATAISDSATTDQIASRVLAIVSEQTGYPSDMLDLDLTWKLISVSTPSSRLRRLPLFARNLTFRVAMMSVCAITNTLERVIGFVKEMA